MCWPYKAHFWLQDTNSCFSGIAGLIVYAAGASEGALDLLLARYAYHKTERFYSPAKIAEMGSFKIRGRLFMDENWPVGLRRHFTHSGGTHRTGRNYSGFQQTIGRLRTT